MIVLATRNLGKVAELRRILTADQLAGHELAGLDTFPDAPEVVETGTTFVENALLKAHAAAAHTGLVAIADDSGLCVDALNAMPGVLSARWSGRHGDERADVALVLAQLADLPAHQRGAGFVCAAVAVTPDGSQRVAQGELRGTLATQPRGSNGFGYDPIFVPAGERRTTAELGPADKDAISHRGKAFRELAPLLAELL